MNFLNKEFIKKCKKIEIVDLSVEQSQLLVAATKTIKNLEKQAESLSVELGSKNQLILFTVNTFSRMKDQIFGLSGEKRLFKFGPLFGHSSEEKTKPSKTLKVRKSFGLPLDRQVKMFVAQDLDIKSQTNYGQIDMIARCHKNTVFKGIANYLNFQKVLLADDTTWKDLAKADQMDCSKFDLWRVCNPKVVCYNILNARSQNVAKDFLGEIEVILVTDGHRSFKPTLGEKLILANDAPCINRNLVIIEKNFPEDPCFFLDKIGELFDLERSVNEEPLDERLETREEQSELIVELIRQETDLSHALPETALGKAFCYAITLWEGLIVFFFSQIRRFQFKPMILNE